MATHPESPRPSRSSVCGRIWNLNTKGILGSRKCITNKGDQGRGQGASSFPFLPRPRGSLDRSEETPRVPRHPRIPRDSSKEPLPDVLGLLAPAATPESWRQGPSGLCSTADTCSRFPPSFPGAAAPGFLFVLSWALNFPFPCWGFSGTWAPHFAFHSCRDAL